MHTHMCLETHEMRDMSFFPFFFRHNIYCDACVFFGALCRAFIAFGLRCHTRIFYGSYFENFGLGLGLALFRLGTQMGPAMKKNFDLSRKFFRAFRENLGFETCFKFQFGVNLAWMAIQVSN